MFDKLAWQREYYWKNVEKRRQYNRERGRDYYKRHKTKRLLEARNNALKRNFGITLDQYNQMITKRNNRCDICNGPPTGKGSLHVDHSHTTNKVRGLLCSKCNQALGLFKDSSFVLSRAVSYLKGELYAVS